MKLIIIQFLIVFRTDGHMMFGNSMTVGSDRFEPNRLPMGETFQCRGALPGSVFEVRFNSGYPDALAVLVPDRRAELKAEKWHWLMRYTELTGSRPLLRRHLGRAVAIFLFCVLNK